MAQFVVSPHMRLHEWVAEEKGFFFDVGLDYTFREQLGSSDGSDHDLGDRIGAYQTFERGRTCDVSAACHWTVNAAAASGHGKLYPGCYSVSPCGIFVPADSAIRRPEDLAGIPISVGDQSVEKYFEALRRAQAEIDLRLELHRHHYRREFPERFHDAMDVRRFGPGERLVFETYTEDIFERSRSWIAERGIFPEGGLGNASYRDTIFAAA